MNLPKGLGMKILAVWLIATGALHLLSIRIPLEGPILAIAAVAAGVLLLLGK